MRISPINIFTGNYSNNYSNTNKNRVDISFSGIIDSRYILNPTSSRITAAESKAYKNIIKILKDNLLDPACFTAKSVDELNLQQFNELAAKLKNVVVKNKEDAPYQLEEKSIISFDGEQVLTQPFEILTLKSDKVRGAKLKIVKTPIRGEHDIPTGEYVLRVEKYDDRDTQLTNGISIYDYLAYSHKMRYPHDCWYLDLSVCC